MLTGHTEMNRVMEARDAGVHEFLAKPISAKSIYARIRAIIERPRPFIRAGVYFGPDRRRRNNPSYKGRERRKENLEAAAEEGEKSGELSQDEVSALLSG
jgi:DNA-binding response OmpR family regulator